MYGWSWLVPIRRWQRGIVFYPGLTDPTVRSRLTVRKIRGGGHIKGGHIDPQITPICDKHRDRRSVANS